MVDLEVVARIFGRCTVFAVGLVLVWFALDRAGICALSTGMFDISRHECALFNYGGIGLAKLLTYAFLLGPWIAIRLEIRRRAKRASGG